MFRPGAPQEEIEQDVESVIQRLVAELDTTAQRDPHQPGAGDRAYIKAFSDARANSDTDQVSLLATAVTRPQLAESLLYLNRNLDSQDLDPREPAGLIGIVVRLAMDGLWVSDILDSTRFTEAQRRRITDLLTRLTYVDDARLGQLLDELTPDGSAPSAAQAGPGERRHR